MVGAHDQSHAVAAGQGQVVVAAHVGRLHQHAEIREPVVEPFHDVLPVIVVQLDAHAGVQLAHVHRGLGQHVHHGGLGGRHVHIALDLFARGNLRPGTVRKLHDLACAPVQQLPLVRQFQGASAVAAHEQGRAHLPLKILDLAGQGRLADAQHLGGRGDALLLHHRDEMTQHLDLHAFPHFPVHAFYVFHAIAYLYLLSFPFGSRLAAELRERRRGRI